MPPAPHRAVAPHTALPPARPGARDRARASASTRVLALQRAAGNRAVGQALARAALRSLSDFRDRLPDDAELAQTREYAAYLDPALIWQTELHASPREAAVACRVMLERITAGEPVRWESAARECLLQARAMLDPAPEPRSPHHYRIEQKAWIPHAHVTDPVGVAGSRYRGDDHVAYAGSWRVLNWVEFDFDGQTITGFTGGEDYGTSHRDAIWGTETGHATGRTGRDHETGASFSMWISSQNPIPWVPAPDIDATVEVIVTCEEISLVYTTDEFPSHGLQVSQDGRVLEEKVILDASVVDGDDPVEIAYGLTEFDNSGALDVTFPRGQWPCPAD